jgi:hypothetical protein
MRGLMSPVEAERFLGLKESAQGRSLLKMAFRKEEQAGRKFVIRKGTAKKTHYKFTAEMIRRYLPELWEGRFERISRNVTETVNRIEAHIDARIDARIDAHPTVQRLADQSMDTLQHVDRLTAQIARLAGTDENRRKQITYSGEGRN